MNILDRIVADTRELTAKRRRGVPVEALRERAGFARATRSLEAALRGPGLAFLAEAKQASPSKGVIREAYDPAEIGRQYEAAGAAAMSVLTEPLHFRGSLEHLEAVRRAVSIPLLRKDFVVEAYQLHEAKAYGADAVLLIAAVLEAAELAELHAEANALGLECLVEVYDVRELEKLDFGQVRILRVNNRNLRTFEVDINHSVRVFAEAPETVVRVSESGLGTADDLLHLRAHGIDAVLIGETFMRETRPGEALRRLREKVAGRGREGENQRVSGEPLPYSIQKEN